MKRVVLAIGFETPFLLKVDLFFLAISDFPFFLKVDFEIRSYIQRIDEKVVLAIELLRANDYEEHYSILR